MRQQRIYYLFKFTAFSFRGEQSINRTKSPKRSLIPRPKYIGALSDDLCSSYRASAHHPLYSKNLCLFSLSSLLPHARERCSWIIILNSRVQHRYWTEIIETQDFIICILTTAYSTLRQKHSY